MRRSLMKSTITALIILLMSGGPFATTWACTACTAPEGDVVQVSDGSEATVTLVVHGMMKSKSGAT